MAFRGKDGVQLTPLVSGTANGSGIDLAQQSRRAAGFHPDSDIVGTRSSA